MNTRNEVIAVTGMTGVGKDFLVEKSHPEQYGLAVVNWGSLLGEELQEDRDTMMHDVDPGLIRAGQLAVCKKILELRPVVVTCHAVRPDNNGNFSYTMDIETKLNPFTYVYITAPPEVIDERVRRRNERNERKSQELPIEEIDRIQRIKLAAVSELAGRLGCNMTVISNTDERLEKNISMMRDVFASLRELA